MARRPINTLSRLGLVICALALLRACAYSPAGLAPSATRADAVGRMGTPTGEYVLPGGATRLEFARGPYGRQTYMLDFDSSGRLTHWEQVLTENHFYQVRKGMNESEVLMQLGRPSAKRGVGWQNITLWSYRFETPFCIWFNVGLDAGKVVDLGYTPDPICEFTGHERAN